jgi:hypothetical protein
MAGSTTSLVFGTGFMSTDTLRELLKNRHALDAIARAVVSGERGLGEAEDALADDVASLMINRLGAAQAAGHRRVAHLEWNGTERRQRVEQRYGRELVHLIIRRTDKQLAHAAFMAFMHGDTQSRDT